MSAGFLDQEYGIEKTRWHVYTLVFPFVPENWDLSSVSVLFPLFFLTSFLSLHLSSSPSPLSIILPSWVSSQCLICEWKLGWVKYLWRRFRSTRLHQLLLMTRKILHPCSTFYPWTWQGLYVNLEVSTLLYSNVTFLENYPFSRNSYIWNFFL